MQKKLKWFLVFIAFLIHLFFYISAFKTHTLDKFFLPVTQGQDFFQIPNGARDFLNGGKLTGENHSFIDCCGVNNNVYHPFFTLLIGVPLQTLPPWTAFNLWLLFHLFSDIIIVVFLYEKFKNHKLLWLALIIFLISNFSYYEILNNQYHFLLNTFTFFFLYEIFNNGESFKSGMYYFLGLIVKPIGLLWIVPLLLYKKYKTLITGLSLFFILTIPFYFLSLGKYYFDNLLGTGGSFIPNYNLIQLLRYLSRYSLISDLTMTTKILIFLFLLIFLLIPLMKKFKLPLILFYLICFQLLFYGGTYPYHYSILPFILSLLILNGEIKIKIPEITFLILLSIPAPIKLMPLIKKAENVGEAGAVVFSLWTIILLLLLIITIFFRNLSENR